MSNQDIAIQEDEDVIFEGSALHEHLSALGYTDFEIAPIIKRQLVPQNKSLYMDNNIINDICKKIYRYSLNLRSWIMQDFYLPKKQLCTILSAEALLDDHATTIDICAKKYDGYAPWKETLQNLFVSGTIITSSTLLFYKYNSALNITIAFCALYFTSYKYYIDIRLHKELKQLVLLQNEFYNLCKKGLKILKHGYKVKINSGKMSQQFHDLMEGRLIYLQPIMENLVKCMEKVSQIYHHAICIIAPELPKHIFEQFIITTFEDNAFKINGEINYEALKKLYHTYVLIQSELLYLFAIAYDINVWSLSCNKISKANLIHITNKLIGQLTKYNNKLSPYIDSYYNCKMKPILHCYKGPVTSQWQDVYLHLNLTSNKIQLAYDYIISMINDIDTCTDNTSTITSDVMIEKMMEKIDKVYKQIDIARNFTDFCRLLITKTKHKNVKLNQTPPETCVKSPNRNSPVVIDTEPEILDEVFEEYIKEEYLKSLYEEDQESLLQEYKLDKLIAKNFMSELKEALIDKQRSMTERESKALERMYRKAVNSASDFESNNSRSLIPIPPPMPSSINDFVSIHSSRSVSNDCKSVPTESMDTSNVGICEKNLNSNNDPSIKNLKKYTNTINASVIDDSEEDSIIFQPLSLKNFKQSAVHVGLNIFPPLSSMKEETYVGSGENSESDIESEYY